MLAVSRIMVAWQPIGIAMGVYDICHRLVHLTSVSLVNMDSEEQTGLLPLSRLNQMIPQVLVYFLLVSGLVNRFLG